MLMKFNYCPLKRKVMQKDCFLFHQPKTCRIKQYQQEVRVNKQPTK